MSKKESGAGLMSSAGLMRYFEAEESAIKIDPKTVVIVAVAFGVLVIAFTYSHKLGFW